MNYIHTPNNDSCGQVINEILDQFVTRKIDVGEKLPVERDMAEELDVSRSTVREAVKVLNYLGFVESVQGSGNYMTNRYEDVMASLFRIMFMRGEFDKRSLLNLRCSLEERGADTAVANATEAQLKEMKSVVEVMDVTTDDELVIQLDKRLHHLVMESGKNVITTVLYNALDWVIDDFMRQAREQVTHQESGYLNLQECHHLLVDSIITKDSESARKAIRAHYGLLEHEYTDIIEADKYPTTRITHP